MLVDAKIRGARRGTHGSRDRSLKRTRRREVFHAPALTAHEVMVVLGEIFCQFVTRELVVGYDAVHDPGGFEHGEVAIGGTLRDVDTRGEYLRERQRPSGIGEEVDKRAAHPCEPLIECRETTRGRVVQLGSQLVVRCGGHNTDRTERRPLLSAATR